MSHRGKMDDGEAELSDHVLVGNPSSPSNIQGSTSASLDSYLDELFKSTTTCSHTHTCNPPGPDALHTHTCYHSHTQVFSSGEDDKSCSIRKPRRSLGNREAVRKYREKKKAHAAYLEEEVKKLRILNQLLGQAVLEAEVSRLRSLVFDIRGKIAGELGSFPLQTRPNSTSISSWKLNVELSQVARKLACPVRTMLGASVLMGEELPACYVDCQESETAGVPECPFGNLHLVNISS